MDEIETANYLYYEKGKKKEYTHKHIRATERKNRKKTKKVSVSTCFLETFRIIITDE